MRGESTRLRMMVVSQVFPGLCCLGSFISFQLPDEGVGKVALTRHCALDVRVRGDACRLTMR